MVDALVVFTNVMIRKRKISWLSR
ncbi:hypothetical protein Patl1_15303 [Pistacia atlantica]|uniref:Uncharacterized protein n=1 Tax=Pistacia atlantica TaxID=434234 RepID=A0ACC1B9B4_9ROSI|nr:hypothetical protein Patl1_15303 [Pistacia atlantica]